MVHFVVQKLSNRLKIKGKASSTFHHYLDDNSVEWVTIKHRIILSHRSELLLWSPDFSQSKSKHDLFGETNQVQDS